MIQMIDYLLGASGFIPVGVCMLLRPELIALHAVSDGLITLSYLAIPAAMWVFLRRRTDLAPDIRQLAWLFIAFIVAASSTHLAAVVTLWVPAFGIAGLVKALTAVVSVATAAAVWPQIPKLLALPSPQDLQRANAQLAMANASLEAAVAWRTHELEIAKQRFEQALSRSNITVFTQDRELTYTWVHNPRAGLRAAEATSDLAPAGDSAEAAVIKRRVLETGETLSTTLALPEPDGAYLYLDLTVSPTHDQQGRIDGILGTAVDVTENRLFEIRLASMTAQLAAANRRFELALENSPITVFEQDTDLRYTFIQNPAPGTEAADYLGRSDAELFEEADQRRIVPAKQRVFDERSRQSLEAELQVGGARRFYDLRLEPKLDDGAVVGVIGMAVDLTERRRNEQQLRLVMRELTHRSKNLLAVIQAMARKTASSSDSTEEFMASFSARLRAMSAAHDLLVTRAWSGAGLGDILRESLAQTVDPASAQIDMAGPELVLAPDAAQNLGLAFHELTTNATKYGALATETGRLGIRWQRADGEVRVRWQEDGGPPVAEPERSGFGRVLLERLVGAALNGTVELDFRPGGVVCEIVFPEDRLIGPEPPHGPPPRQPW